MARTSRILFGLMFLVLALAEVAKAEELNAGALVELALEVNPQIRAARARWNSAEHQVMQNYLPADPVYSMSNNDSHLGITKAGSQSVSVTQALQFPGKALLQGDIAKRAARIARLNYEATVRNIRAQVETGFYQFVLDDALAEATTARLSDLDRVLKVTQTAYITNQVTQTDVVSAQFDYSVALQQEIQLRVSAQNDKSQLNQLLYRRADEPLALDRKIELKRIEVPVDSLVARAVEMRQEILAAALVEENTSVALRLARMEYLPDFNFGYTFDHFLVPSFAPTPNDTQDHTLLVGLNLPIYFWWKQNEDVSRAKFDLEAARDDLGTIRSQTEVAVTILYRQAQVSYQTALLYRDSLIPLAHLDFEVALFAYAGGKISFVALAAALQRSYGARVAYVQAANQFLAQRIALEQTLGAPLP